MGLRVRGSRQKIWAGISGSIPILGTRLLARKEICQKKVTVSPTKLFASRVV